MPIFIVWNKDNNEIEFIIDDFDRAKEIIKNDEQCGLYYPYTIEEYWLHLSKKEIGYDDG